MPKEEKKKEEPAAAEAAAPAKKKLPIKMALAGLAVVILEVATVGVTAMMTGGPSRAKGAETVTTASAPAPEKDVEILIVEAKLPNNQEGKLYIYDLQVVAKVDEKQEQKVEELFKERAAEIKDRIRTIIASSDRKSLAEPGLETLRRQVMYQLEQDLGKDLIKELLIPRCTPYRGEL